MNTLSHYQVPGDCDYSTTNHRSMKSAIPEISKRLGRGTKSVQLIVDRKTWSRQLLLVFTVSDYPREGKLGLAELDHDKQFGGELAPALRRLTERSAQMSR